MDIKNFLKPDVRKIILAVLIFVLFPLPLTLPTMFLNGIYNISSLEFNFLDIYWFVSVIVGLSSPFVSYILACCISSIWAKGKRARLFLAASVLLFLAVIIFINYAENKADKDRMKKARDAFIKFNIESARATAVLYCDKSNKSYYDVCSHSDDMRRIANAFSAQGSQLRCFDGAKEYCAEADLVNSQGEWCADSTGYAGPEANCSASNIACQEIGLAPTYIANGSNDNYKVKKTYQTLKNLEDESRLLLFKVDYYCYPTDNLIKPFKDPTTNEELELIFKDIKCCEMPGVRIWANKRTNIVWIQEIATDFFSQRENWYGPFKVVELEK